MRHIPKPAGLEVGHTSKEQRAARLADEEAINPRGAVSSRPPKELAGLSVARKEWKRVIELYSEIEAEIVTRLDVNLLTQYCILYDQIVELDAIRARLAGDEKSDIDRLIKLDGRLDRKRALLLQYQQSLYLTPRSRAGVSPRRKGAPEPPDELTQLLDGMTEYINGDK